MNNNQIDIT